MSRRDTDSASANDTSDPESGDEPRSPLNSASGKPTSPQSGPTLTPASAKGVSRTRHKDRSPKNSPLLKRISSFMRSKSGRNKEGRPSSSRWRISRKKRPSATALHEFEPFELSQPTWCDVCNDVIWGLINPCFRCERCMLTIHQQCVDSVNVGCPGAGAGSSSLSTMYEAGASSSASSSSSSPSVSRARPPHPKSQQPDVEVGAHGLLAYMSKDEIRQKIEQYNAAEPDVKMELLPDESGKHFKGRIRVNLDLVRPIRVATDDSLFNVSTSPSSSNAGLDPREPVPHERPHRLHRVASSSSYGSGGATDGETCFFLPRNVSKGLFVTSATTTQEVISILLKKFNVISNPRKFSLYEVNLEDQSRRRLRRFEEPLALYLLWLDSPKFALSLQENDTNDFSWEDFSLIELENFLRILDNEEQQAVSQVKQRFEVKRQRLEEAIAVCTNTDDSVRDDTVTEADIRRRCDELELEDAHVNAEQAILELSETVAAADIHDLK